MPEQTTTSLTENEERQARDNRIYEARLVLIRIASSTDPAIPFEGKRYARELFGDLKAGDGARLEEAERFVTRYPPQNFR